MTGVVRGQRYQRPVSERRGRERCHHGKQGNHHAGEHRPAGSRSEPGRGGAVALGELELVLGRGGPSDDVRARFRAPMSTTAQRCPSENSSPGDR